MYLHGFLLLLLHYLNIKFAVLALLEYQNTDSGKVMQFTFCQNTRLQQRGKYKFFFV